MTGQNRQAEVEPFLNRPALRGSHNGWRTESQRDAARVEPFAESADTCQWRRGMPQERIETDLSGARPGRRIRVFETTDARDQGEGAARARRARGRNEWGRRHCLLHAVAAFGDMGVACPVA